MGKQKPEDSPQAAAQAEEKKKRRRRWLLLLLLALLLVPLCLWITSQIAFMTLGMNKANESLLSKLRAGYAPWTPQEFSPLDPALIGTIQAEQATFAANIGGSGGILIPFVPGMPPGTQIAANASATPTPGPSPTLMPSNTSTNTPIVIIYPGTPTTTGGPPPTIDLTTPTVVLTPSAAPTSRPPNADLSISKDDGITIYAQGGTNIYFITVTNGASLQVNNARVSDTFPAQIDTSSVTWTCSASGAGSSCPASGSGNLDNVSVDLGPLGSVTFRVTAPIQPSATGDLVNTATVGAPGSVNDPNTGNNTATDTDTPDTVDLAIAKIDNMVVPSSNGTLTFNRTRAWPGGAITYVITVDNVGAGGATGARVTDNFTGINGISWTCAATGGATCTASGTGNIDDTVDMPAGSQLVYTVNATVNATPTSGTLSNTATVAPPAGVTDSNPGDNNATDNDTIGKPDVVISLHWLTSSPYADLDLWVYDPSPQDPTTDEDESLAYPFGDSASGGQLDADQHCFSTPVGDEQETVSWPSGTGPLLGTYDIYAYYYETCGAGSPPPPASDVTWILTVTVDGTVIETLTDTYLASLGRVSPPDSLGQNEYCSGTQLFQGSAAVLASCDLPATPPATPPPPPHPRDLGDPPTFSFTLP